MSEKISELGGMSLPYSISFFNETGSVDVDTKEIEDPPRYSKTDPWSLYKYVKKIPFVRGFVMLIDFAIKLIKFLYERKLYFLGAILIVIFVLFAPEKEIVVISEPNFFWDNFPTYGFYLVLIIFLYLATKNHAAEHKVISAYETKQDLSMENIKKQPKENRRCGTVLVMWILIFIIPIDIFLDIPFRFLFIFPIVHEIFLLARKRNLIGNIVYFPGWLGQKITTREPDDTLLLRAREGLMELLDKGGFKYKT